MICKKCGKDISGDCVLTGRPDVEGVCVFCHYNTNTWDSNGQLVTKDQATRGIGWFTAEDLFFDNIMRNYICEDCDRIIYEEELDD